LIRGPLAVAMTLPFTSTPLLVLGFRLSGDRATSGSSGGFTAPSKVCFTFIRRVIALILNIPVRLLQKRLGFKRSWAIVAVFLLLQLG